MSVAPATSSPLSPSQAAPIVPPPPQELAYLADAIGPHATLALLERFGGTRIFIPATARPGQKLAQAIGAEAEAALVRTFGGGSLKVPLCKWWRARVYRARGCTYSQIALKLGCTEKTVGLLLRPGSVAHHASGGPVTRANRAQMSLNLD